MNMIARVSALALCVAVALKLAGFGSSLVGLLGLIAMVALLVSGFRAVFLSNDSSNDLSNNELNA